MTKGEEMFLDQYTRKLMVEMCRSQMTYGSPFQGPVGHRGNEPFVDYAVKKGWLSKDMTRVLSGGWMTAARFLKR
jgi:hypothetical protein